GDKRLTVGGIKRYMDGALGARGAWLLKPYSDLPSEQGLNTIDLNTFKQSAQLAIENQLQLCTHAIGDKANRVTLDIYENVFQHHPQKTDLRWRIEHAQHLHADDIPRFAELGVTAAMQSIHCTSDAPWVYKRLGEDRAADGAYVWQKLRRSGALICNGTDAPVEPVNPIDNFYAAVTRKPKDMQPFFPDQALTRMEALRTYTINGAKAVFEEDIKGSITPGKLADLTVLSKDILTIPAEDVRNTKVEMTILGGQIVFDSGRLTAGVK
ncbi:MAG: amidohydrolase family protein, partial [Caldithrix sp.]|nr:amidohydrolase family protein [Caldithrix sp.]